MGDVFYGDETLYKDTDRMKLTIVKDRLFQQSVLRINYTTYDMRRDQDSINPRTHADIMILAGDTSNEQASNSNSHGHPYWYARVIGIFQATVKYTDPNSSKNGMYQMDFLFVRWFGDDPGHRSGFKAKRLHRIGFVPQHDEAAFGFLDPDQVIRGVHLIPAFAYGQTSAVLNKSFIRRDCQNDKDWQIYYVNQYVSFKFYVHDKMKAYRFVDRDMFMRFIGGGVGHMQYGALIQESILDGSTDILESAQDAMILNEMDAEVTAAENSQNRSKNANGPQDVKATETQGVLDSAQDLEDSDDNSSNDLASENEESDDESESVFDFS